ncbi:MAG: TolC family protein [Verrucomicrobia bacterium]|nr:TolC family protein [Verrucomicrobiota bacterium]
MPFAAKVFIRSFITLGICLSATPLLSANAIDLNLRSAMERASQANINLLLEQENVVTAQQERARTRSNLLPSVDLIAGQSRSSGMVNGLVGPERMYSSRFEALLRGRLSLFDVTNHANDRVARFNVEIADLNLENTAQSVWQSIGSAYFSHLRNVSRLELLQVIRERDTVLLDLSRNQFEAGAATSIDVTRAEVQLADTELSILRQETLVYQSELALKRLLNLQLEAPLNLQPFPITERNPQAFQSAMLLRAAEQRPDLRAAKLTLERNRVARRAAGLERLPSLELTGDYGFGGRDPGSDLDEQWRIALGFSMPLFDGFRIRANRLQADSLIRRQEAIVDDLMQQLEADLRFDLRDIISTWQQIQVAQKRVDLSEREYRLAQTRFQEGVADNRDVVDAQARLANAQEGLIEAEFAYKIALLSFARSRGDVLSILDFQ